MELPGVGRPVVVAGAVAGPHGGHHAAGPGGDHHSITLLSPPLTTIRSSLQAGLGATEPDWSRRGIS